MKRIKMIIIGVRRSFLGEGGKPKKPPPPYMEKKIAKRPPHGENVA